MASTSAETRHFGDIRLGGATRAAMALVAALALVVCALLVTPSTALARDYSISGVNIDATVASDGSLSVTEDRTYVFDGSFHGVYWEIPDGSYDDRDVSVSVQSVGVVNGGNYQKYVSSADEQSGSYTVSSDYSDSGSSVQKITIYSTQSDATVTFRIQYVLTGGVSAWADTGELYWKFVSDGWDVPSQNVTCTVHLPGTATTSADDTTIRVWAHGPLNGEVTRNSDGATFTVPEVGTEEYAEARIVFPVSWLSGMTPSSTSKLDSILSEEQTWADEANAQRTQAKVVVFGGDAGLGALVLGSIVKLIRSRKRYKLSHTPVFNDEYFRDVPSSDHPSVLGALMRDGEAHPEDFTAALMRLSDMHAINLDLVTTTTKSLFGTHEDKDYRLTRNPQVADKLKDPVDVATMDFLFDFVAPKCDNYQKSSAGKDVLLFSDVSRVAKNSAESYAEHMDSWKGKVTSAAERRGFFVDTGDTGQAGLTIFGILDIVVAIVGGVIVVGVNGDAFLGMILAVALFVVGVVLIAMARGMDSLSAEAVEIRAKMVALKKWLCEFTRLKEAVPSDVILWNKLLVLAVVLGVADQVIKQLRVSMPELLQDPDFMPTYYWYMGYGGMPSPADTFTNAYNTAAQVNAAALASSTMSSGGGFGGGFSGGGGGGFGGGGGGGAF